MNTTRTSADNRSGIRWLVAGAGLATSGALLALAGPIVAGSAAALPGDEAARSLRHRTAITEEGILAVIESRGRALDRYGALEWRRELATASLTARGGQPVPPEAVARAARETRKALSQAPGAPRDWLRLASIELREGNRRAAIGHLSTAFTTGADMPRARATAIDLSFALWPDLPGETRVQAIEAVRNQWRSGVERKWLLSQARAAGLLPLVTFALAGEAKAPRTAHWATVIGNEEKRP